MGRESLGFLDELFFNHSRKVLSEAKKLRSLNVSHKTLMRVYKPKWEKELLEVLRESLGEVGLLGKDLGSVGLEGSKWVCMCDVLDGSLNFMCGLKYYAYSAAMFYSGKPVYGLVIDLDNQAYFRAEEGRGAVLVDGEDEVRLGDNSVRPPDNYQAITSNVVVRGLNSVELRCSVLEICLMARGVADVWIGRTWTPEIAAGYVIAREAGAEFRDWGFNPVDSIPIAYTELRCVAGSSKLLEELKARVNGSLDRVLAQR